MRVVLDTDVMVAAIRSDAGASRRLLLAALEQRCVALISVPLMFEYEAVLTREPHLRATRLTVEDVSVVLDALAVVAEPVKLAYLWRPFLQDPMDDLVLEVAVNGQADAVATFNQRDFVGVAGQFGIAVERPAQALKRLGA